MNQPGITTALKKIKKLDSRLRVVQGGSSASKTYSILLYLIDLAQRDEKPTLTSVVSETFPHLKRGAIRDFNEILTGLNRYNDKSWNKTDWVYTVESGSKIEFFSADQPDKVRGPRRQRMFINEANNVPFETFEQLEIRTDDFIFIDYNPVSEFWVNDKIFGKREDYDHLILTYKDNEALNENIIRTLEMKKDRANFWKVYGEGKFGELEGKIFKGWQWIDKIPHEARLERRGLDFGYSLDPSALVDIYYYNGGYILDEQLYQTGMSNKKIADFILDLDQPETLVIADSAEPKSIDEIYGYGVNIRGAEKGRDSVRQGIQFMQDIPISATKRSVNLRKEYRNYVWATDRLGETVTPNKPEDAWNHLCFAKGTKVFGKNIEEIGTKTGIKKVYEYNIAGECLKATKDHPVLTHRGFVDIDALRYNDVIWKKKMLLYMQVSGGLGILKVVVVLVGFIIAQAKRIIEAKTRDYTDLNGKKKTDLSQRDIVFIMLTATPLIILWTILNLLTALNTLVYTGLRKSERKLSKLLPSGQKQRKEEKKGKKWVRKIINILKNTKKINQLLKNIVICVEKNTKQNTRKEVDGVIQTAKQKHYVGLEPVYTLKTKSGMFPANGIMVSNCDAARYALSTLERRDPTKEKQKLKQYIYQKNQRQKSTKKQYGL